MRIAKVFAALTGILVGVVSLSAFVFVGVFISKSLGLWDSAQALRVGQTYWFCAVVAVGAFMVAGAILSIGFANVAGDHIEWKLQEAARKQAEALMPILYECQNNGVSVLITAEQRKRAFERMVVAKGNLMLVPDAMVFAADNHFYPMRLDNIRTGNWTDMKNLIESCIVKPDSIHVNYSSFNMVDKTYQCANFHPPTLVEAKRLIDQEKSRLTNVSWRRRNTFYVVLFGFGITILVFVTGMLAILPEIKTCLFGLSALSLVFNLWTLRRLNSL